MTVSRTDASLHPTALLVDVFDGVRLITERLFERERTVSLGRSRRNSVVLDDDRAPRSVPLFHRDADGYTLHYTDATRGSIAPRAGSEYQSLAELRAASGIHRGGYDLHLDEGARGRVDLGAETVVFEVVPASLEAAPPALARDGTRWIIATLVTLALVTLAGVGVMVGLQRATLDASSAPRMLVVEESFEAAAPSPSIRHVPSTMVELGWPTIH